MVKPPCVRRPPLCAGESGYAMVAMLVAMSVMGIMLSVALPAWHTAARREKEAELVFRGEQYARALAMFSRKYPNASPPNVDILVTERLLRKKYKDPITGGEFEYLTPGTAIEGAATPPGQRGSTTQPGRGATNTGRGGTTTTAQARGGSLLGQLRPLTAAQAASPAAGRGTSQTAGGPARPGTTGVGATAGVTGVRSKSTEKSLRVYNGAERYDQWLFVVRQSGAAGAGAAGGAAGPQGPAGRGQRGRGIGPQPSTGPGRGPTSLPSGRQGGGAPNTGRGRLF
jgi:type II secretory pathway pseudopilin PulG